MTDHIQPLLHLLHFDRGGTPVTSEEHDRQRDRVDHSTRLSLSRAERQQEAATIARLRPRTGNVENNVPFHPPEPPRAA